MKKLLILLSLILAMLLLASCAIPGFGGEEEKEEGNGTGEQTPGEGEGENNELGDPNCAHKDDETLFIKDRAVKATCTENGLTAKEYCMLCGYVKTPAEVIPATGHTKVAIAATEATCAQEGATAGVRCTACNQTLVTPTTIPKLNHVVVKSSDVEATCTSPGSIGGTHCIKCYETIEAPEVVPAFGHDRGLEHIHVTEGYAPTCKDEGLTDNVYCSICDTDIIVAKVIPTSEHRAEDLIVVPGYVATCVAQGLSDGEFCTFCETTTIEQVVLEIDANCHPAESCTVLEAVAVTCYADGLTEGSFCNACNNVAVAQEAITDRPAHTLKEFAPAVDPDCSTETHGCTVHLYCDVAECDYEEPATVIKYKHELGEWTVTLEAGVGTEGERYTHCQECGKLIEEQIPALPEGDNDLPGYIDPDGLA